MPTTSNFGWTTPADTDLVKDGAAAIRTLGNGVDSSFVDLKGGTSGQILSKNSNTDLDFVWIANDQGDITAVTAGTGISGGGTSGAVTITNSMATEIDAKGDLIVGTGADTFARLPVGTNGHTLVADSVETTGLKWVAPAGGGKVLQVVYGSSSTSTAISSTTYTDTTLSASITPSSATSKVLVIVSQVTDVIASSAARYGATRLLRDSTAILTPSPNREEQIGIVAGGATNVTIRAIVPMVYLDSPNTTSAITYKTQGALNAAPAGSTITFQINTAVSTIVLMEIGA